MRLWTPTDRSGLLSTTFHVRVPPTPWPIKCGHRRDLAPLTTPAAVRDVVDVSFVLLLFSNVFIGLVVDRFQVRLDCARVFTQASHACYPC